MSDVEPWDHHVTSYPFHTSHAHKVPAAKVGRVMAGVHTHWHAVQLFGFRFVLMWPVRQRPEEDRPGPDWRAIP